jgi:hypothetical protein
MSRMLHCDSQVNLFFFIGKLDQKFDLQFSDPNLSDRFLAVDLTTAARYHNETKRPIQKIAIFTGNNQSICC